jgi:hypothetical protein
LIVPQGWLGVALPTNEVADPDVEIEDVEDVVVVVPVVPPVVEPVLVVVAVVFLQIVMPVVTAPVVGSAQVIAPIGRERTCFRAFPACRGPCSVGHWPSRHRAG